MTTDVSKIMPFLLALLVMFAVYRRLRRSFGQQPLRPKSMWVRIGVLLIVTCLLLPVALSTVAFMGAALIGLMLGVLLAFWGAARTRFVRNDGRVFYVPHTYTGIAVSLLFIGRLAYRLIQMYAAMHAQHAAGSAPDPALTQSEMVRSPLTMGLFFVLMGYYVCYYGLVLRNAKRVVFDNEGSAPA
jgi:hypothetical protein